MLAKIADGIGPPWWRPIARRRWRRLYELMERQSYLLMLARQAEEAAFMVEQVAPFAERVCVELSKQLPDGYEFKWD